MRVRTDIGALERLEFLGTEMIEEQERADGLPLGRGKQAANLQVAHGAQPRLQEQELGHYAARATIEARVHQYSSSSMFFAFGSRYVSSLMSLPCW